ncbi:MAG TPA: AAA family ATPase [Candidatus Limnocylindria bacterium]|nr:AAA family ATPase [Candidatus Limnocylindria bacterium]
MSGDRVAFEQAAGTVGRDVPLATRDAALVGRDAELDRLEAFVGDVAALPAAFVIEGPAGAGKTTLWRAGVDAAEASGYVVLACRAAGAEVQLSHAALSDLLEPHLAAVLPLLPRPQRRALEVALLLDDDEGSPPDQRAIAAGALSAIRALARTQPVLLAVDDAQWVDAPSAEVIEFAIRRLGRAPVAILATRRLPSPTAPAPGASVGVRPDRVLQRATTRVEVGPLSLGAIQRILVTRTSFDANRRTLQRIHETSGGNPFYALELARSIAAGRATDNADRDQGRSGSAGGSEPLAVGGELGELLAERLLGLARESREALFVAAALAEPTIDGVAVATGQSREAIAAALDAAIATSIVRVDDGVIEFAHPLLAAAAYGSVDASERRRWHARIAETAGDPETRARHLAVAHPGPDAEVASQLASAARSARNRGAAIAAAELFDKALATLPRAAAGETTSAALRAALVAEAAPIMIATGQSDMARTLLEASIGEIPAGLLRSDLKLLLGELVENDEAGLRRQMAMIDEALAEAEGDPRRIAAALLDREQIERASDRSPNALPLALRALALAEESGDERLLARAHVRAADLEVVLGLVGDPVRRFKRALELGDRVPVDAENSAPSMLAVCLIRAGRLDEARPYLTAERVRASAEGDEASFCWVSLYQSELEWFAGRWDDARACAAEALEVAEQAGLRMRSGGLQSIIALVEISRGDPDTARTLAQRAISVLDDVDEVAYGNYARQMLAFLELSLGNAAATTEQLDTYPAERLEGSKRLAFIGDQIEALVALGDLGRAANLADDLAARGEHLHRPPLVATAARCRALVLGARGEPGEAVAAARDAIAIHGALGLPFERARSLLVLGEVQRRAKHRRDARETLTEAIEAFDALGAHLWSAKAKRERARIGGRSTIEGLSETELRVARLVAEGRSNKEVAAELFVSVRAVEANLSKVYAKLGIESRTELARRL